jgi:hypothetical protein
MNTLVVTYAGAWLAVCAYVTWMAYQNAAMKRRLHELEELGRKQAAKAPSKAA